MRFRLAGMIWSCAVLLIAAPSTGMGQAEPARLNVGAFAGVAAGPAPSIAFGLDVDVPLTRGLSLLAGYARRTGGLVACDQSWPASYECDVRGQSLLAGARLQHPLDPGDVTPYAELSGGAFRRPSVAGESSHTAAALAFGAGISLPVSRIWALRLRGQRSWILDDDYESLTGERLRYTTADLAVVLRVR